MKDHANHFKILLKLKNVTRQQVIYSNMKIETDFILVINIMVPLP